MKKEKKERKKECKPLIFPIAKSVSIKASVKIAFYVFFSFPIKGINLSLFSTPVPHMPTFFPPQRTLFKTIIFRCFFFFFFRLLFPSSTSSTAFNILLQHFLFVIPTKHLWTPRRAFKRHHVFAHTATRRRGTSACPAPSICSGESFVHLPLKHTTSCHLLAWVIRWKARLCEEGSASSVSSIETP